MSDSEDWERIGSPESLKLSIIIPVFNEESFIREVIQLSLIHI